MAPHSYPASRGSSYWTARNRGPVQVVHRQLVGVAAARPWRSFRLVLVCGHA